MNIFDLFNALESELNKRERLVKSGNGECLRIFAALKNAVKSELDTAIKISSERDDILKNADDTAQTIINTANRRAEEILKAAVEKQGGIMRNFAIYLDSKLCECEKALSSMVEDIRADRAKLFPQ